MKKILWPRRRSVPSGPPLSPHESGKIRIRRRLLVEFERQSIGVLEEGEAASRMLVRPGRRNGKGEELDLGRAQAQIALPGLSLRPPDFPDDREAEDLGVEMP